MDILTRLQALPLGRFHFRLLGLIGLGWLFDAMDTGMISFVLVKLGPEWGLNRSQLGWVVSIGFIGMALGAVLSGWLADRYGRPTVFVATMLLYGAATGGCALAGQLDTLLFWRFWVGVGLGGQLPVAVALVSEYAPARQRGRLIVLLESFWGLGWLGAALVSYYLIPSLGWRSAFAVGALPLLYALLVWRHLPESVAYLIGAQRLDEAHALLCRLESQAGLTPAPTAIAPAPTVKTPNRLRELWRPALARRTLMLWLIWFGIVFSYYGIFTWLPQLLADQGFTIVKTFRYVLWLILAQLPGYFAAALLVEIIGRKITLAGFLGACALCAYQFGGSASNGEILWWGCWMSFFNLGAWGVLYTYTPELYPVRCRAFGAGWAGAIGRLGGIIAPLVVAEMSGPTGFSRIFLMFALVLAAVVLVIVALGEETRGRTLEEISASSSR